MALGMTFLAGGDHFFLGTQSIAQFRSCGARLFHFRRPDGLWAFRASLPSVGEKFGLSSTRWSTDKTRLSLGRKMVWLWGKMVWLWGLEHSWWVGCANLSELLSNGIILIWSLPRWDTTQLHAQPILNLERVENVENQFKFSAETIQRQNKPGLGRGSAKSLGWRLMFTAKSENNL